MKKLFVLLSIFSLLFISYAYSQDAQKKSLSGKKTEVTKEADVKKTTTDSKSDPAKSKLTPAKDDKAKPADKKATAKGGKKPIKGKVVSFSDLVTGGTGAVTKEKAIELADKGQPIVFQDMSKKIYFVYHTDGGFAAKKLANFAGAKFVGIVGKTKTINGVKVIIADMIDAME